MNAPVTCFVGRRMKNASCRVRGVTWDRASLRRALVGAASLAFLTTLASAPSLAFAQAASDSKSPLPPLPPPTAGSSVPASTGDTNALPPLPPPTAGSSAPLPLATVPSQGNPPPTARPIPPAPSCGCASGCATCEDKKRGPAPGSGVLGIRSQYTRAESPSASTDAASVSFAGRAEGHNDDTGFVASRANLDFAIGGGSADVEGLFGGALMLGVRVPVAVHHAPFFRFGLSGETQGNDRYLYSRFDFPLGEAGYQYVSGGTLFEAGIRLSPLLTGRLRANTETRVLSSSFSYGAFVAARGEGGRLDFLYTRVDAKDGLGRGVDTVQALGCALPFGFLALCIDGQLVGTDLVDAQNRVGTLRTGYIGGLIGLGTAGLR